MDHPVKKCRLTPIPTIPTTLSPSIHSPLCDIAALRLTRYLPAVMNITLPEPLESTLTPSQAALHLAIGLFTAWEVTLGQAAEAAGISQSEFMRELGRRKISLHYGVEDFAEDLIAIEKLRAR